MTSINENRCIYFKLSESTTFPNAWEFLRNLNKFLKFQTKEGKRVGPVSNSELKRWLQSGSVICNGEKLDWDEPMDFVIYSFVLFPKNPITLF